MQIRPFRIGDELELRAVFFSAVREIACAHYSAEQLDAWAPQDFDAAFWSNRMQVLQPFVVENDSHLLGYTDLQANGHIDHFFVAGPYARKGIGTMLMNHIHEAAAAKAITSLTSNVSVTAQPFFAKFGFLVVTHQSRMMRGLAFSNALMRKELVNSAQ